MWRVYREQDIEVTFIGDKRGAGLSIPGVHDYQGSKRYRFNAADSKDIQVRLHHRQRSKLASLQLIEPPTILDLSTFF